MDAGDRLLSRPRVYLAVALLALLYGGAHLAWYVGTPLGRSPVLDERENLQLAAQLTAGALPPEPFYRAMGYPLFLAGLRTAGLVTDDLPQVALVAGLLLHGLNSLLVARLALLWFTSPRAALAAGLLHGLNPVLIHYATQILDGTFANTFLLLGLQFLPRPEAPGTVRSAVGLSLAWTAAALVRPQFVFLWLALPLVWLAATGSWRRQLRPLGGALLAGGLLWLAQGLWSWRSGGEFRLLPWQGAYNLWAANHPGANGRYYTQTILLEAVAGAPHENPARTESIIRYRQATGDTGPLRITAFNQYWLRRLRSDVAADPAGWLVLACQKACYLLNHFEQYNNKTYSFHRDRSPWLHYNPLGWGPLLLAGGLGLIVLGRTNRPLFAAALLAGGAVAGGIILGYISARFRLPLSVLLCVMAGGAIARPRAWWPDQVARRIALAVLLVTLGVAAFGNWFNAADRSTWLQDHLLLAHAAERLGEDRTVWDEARAALALSPLHPEAQRLVLVGGFNLLLAGAPVDEAAWREVARRDPAPAAHPAGNIIALALWRDGDTGGAALLWRLRLKQENDPEALAALWLAGLATPAETSRLQALPAPASQQTFQLLARARLLVDQPDELRAPADRLFPPAP
jgi:hypothetical protein